MDALNFGTTLFYFDRVEILNDYESFNVHPCDYHGQQVPENEADKADYWTVSGKLKANAETFVIADLPTELYARLFAQMCLKFVSNTGCIQKLKLPELLKTQTA